MCKLLSTSGARFSQASGKLEEVPFAAKGWSNGGEGADEGAREGANNGTDFPEDVEGTLDTEGIYEGLAAITVDGEEVVAFGPTSVMTSFVPEKVLLLVVFIAGSIIQKITPSDRQETLFAFRILPKQIKYTFNNRLPLITAKFIKCVVLKINNRY